MFSRELFGQRVREARKRCGETQTELGNFLGIQKGQISEIEKGTASTTVERVAMICEHYQVSADYLLGLSDDPRPRKGGEENGTLG